MVAAAVPTTYHAVTSSPATFTPTPLEFAVPDLIPLGGITTILAPSGAGRTTLAAMLLAAFVPSPAYKPDSLFTAYFSPLANPHREFRQRLVQLNVPLHTVRFYEHLELTDPQTAAKARRPFTLEDLPILESHLEHNPTLRMLVIDSAELFLACSSPRRFQQQLFQLNLLARRRKLAVVLLLPVLKLRENPFHNAMLQTLSQASQLTYLLTPPLPASAHKNEAEPDHLAQPTPSCLRASVPSCLPPEPDHLGSSFTLSTFHSFSFSTSGPRLLIPLKTTLPTPIPTRQLLTLPPLPTRLPTSATLFPTHAANLTYADYLQLASPSCLRASVPSCLPRKPGPDPVQLDYTCEVLRDLLKDGPLPVGQSDDTPNSLRQKLAAAGLPWRSGITTRRAKQALQIEAFRHQDTWYWRLPSTPAAQKSEAEPDHLAQPTPSCLRASVPSCLPPHPDHHAHKEPTSSRYGVINNHYSPDHLALKHQEQTINNN